MLRVNIQIIDDIFIVGNYQVKYVSKVMCGFIYCLGEIKLKQQVTEFVGSRGRATEGGYVLGVVGKGSPSSPG